MTTSVTHKGFHAYRGAAVVLLMGLWLMPSPLCVRADDQTPHSKTTLPAGKTTDTPQDSKAIQKEIQAAYDQQSAALSRKDVPGFLALCTPDYRDLARGKRLFSAKFIRQTLPRTLAKYSTLTMTAAIETLAVKGSQATVTATHHVNVTFLPRYAAGVPTRSSETVTEDIWIKTENGWRVKRSKEIGYKRQTAPLPTSPTPAKAARGKTAASPAR